MNTLTRNTLLVTITIAAAVAFSWDFFGQPLRVGVDESYMLQAALRHADGAGLTVTSDSVGSAAPLDITAQEYIRLTYFPPLYPSAISLLLQAGLSLESAVKLLNAFALLAGVVGWFLLSSRTLVRTTSLAIFCALLIVTGAADVPSVAWSNNHTADYLLWAGTPYWLLALVIATASPLFSTYLSRAIAAAALVALFITIRWAAVFMVPAGVLVIWLGNGGEFSPRKRALVAVLYAAIPTALYIGLSVWNKLNTDIANPLSSISPSWDLTRLWTIYPLDAFFLLPLGLESVVYKIELMLRSVVGKEIVGTTISVTVALCAVAMATVMWVRLPKKHDSSFLAKTSLRLVVGITFATLVAFLTFMTLRYNLKDVDWSYLGEPRYYAPILPALGLFWLSLFEDAELPKPFHNMLAAFLVLCIGIAFFSNIKHEYRAWQQSGKYREADELREKLHELTEQAPSNIVVDYALHTHILEPLPNTVLRRYPRLDRIQEMPAASDAELWVIKYQPSSSWFKDPKHHVRHFDAMAKRFDLKKVWSSSDGYYEIYNTRLTGD